MKIRKVNFFEADFNVYSDSHELPDKIKATFPVTEGESDPQIDLKDVLGLKTLAETGKRIKLPRSKLSSYARYGIPVTLQEETFWYTELTTRAIRNINQNNKSSNSETIYQALKHIIDSSITNEDEGSGISSQNLFWFEVKKMLRKVFFIQAYNRDGSKAFEGFQEISLPEYTYHPIPLLKFLLLGIIEPKLLSEKEFRSLCTAFDLADLDDLPPSPLSPEFIGEFLFKNTFDIKEMISGSLNKFRENSNSMNSGIATFQKDLNDDEWSYIKKVGNVFVDKTISVSFEKINIMKNESLLEFYERFKILRHISSKAGSFNINT